MKQIKTFRPFEIFLLLMFILLFLSGCLSITTGYERCEVAYLGSLPDIQAVDCNYYSQVERCQCSAYNCEGEICKEIKTDYFTLKEDLITD